MYTDVYVYKLYTDVYVYIPERKKGAISVILGGYLGYKRGVSRLFGFLEALIHKALRPVKIPNTVNTVKQYRPHVVRRPIPA